MSQAQPTVAYRDVPGFPGYRVGDDGSVLSRWNGKRLGDTWRAMVTKWRPGDYRRVMLSGRKNVTIHKLVLEAFVGPRPAGMECRHLDGDRTNNRVSNLQWDTRQENMADRKRHGTAQIGSRHGKSQLTECQVANILSEHSHGVNVHSLAVRYGVCKATIRFIICGRTWKHVARL